MKPKWAGVARFGGVGDNLIAASVARGLKLQGFTTEYLTATPASCVFENNPYIDRIIVKDKDTIPSDGLQWQLWFANRAKEYDRFANLSHSCEALCAFFVGSTPFWWPEAARRKFANRNYLEVVHDILDVPYEFGPLFFPTAEEIAKAQITKRKIGERYIGWCLSGTRIDKVYPHAPAVIARIIRELDIPVVMFGAPGKDSEMARLILEYVEHQNSSHKHLHSAISPDPEKPTWPIRRVLTQALFSDLLVAPDTGPSWACAFAPVPKVIILSHASPENVTKHWTNTITLHANQKEISCYPCHRLHDDPSTCRANKENTGAACVSSISVETMMTWVKRGLRL